MGWYVEGIAAVEPFVFTAMFSVWFWLVYHRPATIERWGWWVRSEMMGPGLWWLRGWTTASTETLVEWTILVGCPAQVAITGLTGPFSRMLVPAVIGSYLIVRRRRIAAALAVEHSETVTPAHRFASYLASGLAAQIVFCLVVLDGGPAVRGVIWLLMISWPPGEGGHRVRSRAPASAGT